MCGRDGRSSPVDHICTSAITSYGVRIWIILFRKPHVVGRVAHFDVIWMALVITFVFLAILKLVIFPLKFENVYWEMSLQSIKSSF